MPARRPGAAFGAWALTTLIVLALVALSGLRSRELRPGRLALLVAAGAAVVLVAAWPTWSGVAGSIQVARNIASTANSGNLTSSLHPLLVFGAWIWGSYQELPGGAELAATQALILLTGISAVIGVVHLIRTRSFALLGWMALMLLVWLIVSRYVTAWAGAKTIMLTSPVMVLLAWGGVAGLRASRLRILAPALAFMLAAGVLASDLYQYNSTNLAPTARYDELGSLNSRFAGQGPAIFTGFDEYALYQLRDLDLTGPDFRYRPVDLAGVTMGHGHSVDLERAPPDDLGRLPADHHPARPAGPAAAVRLQPRLAGPLLRGVAPAPARPVPLARVVAHGGAEPKCTLLGTLARTGTSGDRMVGSLAPRSVRVHLQLARHPAAWTFQQSGVSMTILRDAHGAVLGPRGRRLGAVAAGAADGQGQGQHRRRPGGQHRRRAGRGRDRSRLHRPVRDQAAGGGPHPACHPRDQAAGTRRRRNDGAGRRVPGARRARRADLAAVGPGRRAGIRCAVARCSGSSSSRRDQRGAAAAGVG